MALKLTTKPQEAPNYCIDCNSSCIVGTPSLYDQHATEYACKRCGMEWTTWECVYCHKEVFGPITDDLFDSYCSYGCYYKRNPQFAK